MNTADVDTLVWPILSFDSMKAKPLPLTKRYYRLDRSKASDKEMQGILAIVGDLRRPLMSIPYVPNATVSTTVSMIMSRDRRLLKYRQLFTECSIDDLKDGGAPGETFNIIPLDPDYIEDEHGRSIAMHEIIRKVSGCDKPIIYGEPNSVLCLGPVGRRQEENWTINCANTIAKFLHVVRLVGTWQWLNSQVSITVSGDVSVGDVTAVELPNGEVTLSVLPFMRQLYSSSKLDNLFNKACDTYTRHASHNAKIDWIKHEKVVFDELLKNEPYDLLKIEMPTSNFVDTVIYGASLMHSHPNGGADKKFDALVAKHGRNRVIYCFQSCLRSIYAAAARVGPVIAQDFRHWIEQEGAAKPTAHDPVELFASGGYY